MELKSLMSNMIEYLQLIKQSIDMLKVKGYTMTMKEMFDGRDNLTNISDDTK